MFVIESNIPTENNNEKDEITDTTSNRKFLRVPQATLVQPSNMLQIETANTSSSIIVEDVQSDIDDIRINLISNNEIPDVQRTMTMNFTFKSASIPSGTRAVQDSLINSIGITNTLNSENLINFNSINDLNAK